MNTIGMRIRKIREEQGIKQEYIAHRMGIGQSNYGRLEKNDDRITITKLMKISEILAVPVSVFFGEKSPSVMRENKGDDAQTQIEALVLQNKENIEFIKETMKFLYKVVEDKCI